MHSPSNRTSCRGPVSSARALWQVATRVSDYSLYALAVLAGYLATPSALGLSLDAIAEQSRLGEPFRVVVPLVIQPGQELTGECVKLSSSSETVDSLPEIRAARIGLERIDATMRLVVTTGRAVNEPAMRMTLQVGCTGPIRREYTMLFDPPLADVLPVTTSPNVSAGGASTALGDSSGSASTLPAPTDGASAPARIEPVPAVVKERPAADKAATRPAARRRVLSGEQTKLTISRTVKGDTGKLSKRAQMAATDEDLVVLRNRIAELTLQVERAQQEKIAELSGAVQRLEAEAREARAAQRAAEEAAQQSPWRALAGWSSDSWLPLIVVLASGLALGSLIGWRRGMRSSQDGSTPLLADAKRHLFDADIPEPLLAGREIRSFVTEQDAPIQGSHVETATLYANQHEDDFDRDIIEGGQPAVTSSH
jgi:pilus assembly protein FimV